MQNFNKDRMIYMKALTYIQKFIVPLLLMLVLTSVTLAETTNSQYLSDPMIPDDETLVYRVTNEDRPGNNRLLTYKLNREGDYYLVTMITEYERATRQHRNNTVVGILNASDMMPIKTQILMNDGVHFNADYLTDSVSFFMDERTIEGYDDAEYYEYEIELFDIVLDRELIAVQLRGLNFTLEEEYDAQLINGTPSWMPDVSCEISIEEIELVNNIQCYKVEADLGLVLGEVVAYYEVASPHRLIKLYFDVFQHPFNGDVFVLQH